VVKKIAMATANGIWTNAALLPDTAEGASIN
jgi:hypothetical protein